MNILMERSRFELCCFRLQEHPCRMVRSGEVSLECDAKCKELIDKRQNEEKEKQEAIKAEELRKQKVYILKSIQI